EHMAMEHDWRSVGLVTRAVAERLAPRVLVTEGLMCGISEHHMRHPGTLTLSPGTFLAVLGDMIESMVRAGFKNIIVVNGHGGNIEPVRGTWDQFLRRFEGVNLHFLSFWDTLGQADADELLQGAKRMPDDLPGHAQEFETSIALAKFPENVRADAVADQTDPNLGLATAEQGEEWFERVTERLAKFVGEVIDGERQSEAPPFHP
ncbi:MAG: creatininase family protein, partial [Verrucomicrobiota bacterium]|nr:creatininase family protein [Verrucomicrobiota bacterium]